MQKSSIHSNLIHLEPNSTPHPTSRIEFSRGKRSRPTELADNPFKNSHRSLVLVLLHRRLFISPSFEESCGQTFHHVFVAHAREPHSIVKTKGLRETFTKSRNVRICVYKTACIRIHTDAHVNAIKALKNLFQRLHITPPRRGEF